MSLTLNSKLSHSHSDQTNSSEESASGLQFVEPHADEDQWKSLDTFHVNSFPQESIESDFEWSAYGLKNVLRGLAFAKQRDNILSYDVSTLCTHA